MISICFVEDNGNYFSGYVIIVVLYKYVRWLLVEFMRLEWLDFIKIVKVFLGKLLVYVKWYEYMN